MYFQGLVRILSLVLLSGLTSFAFAEECSRVSLLDPGQAMASMQTPVHQGQMKNCYAHVAAQMIDAYRFGHGDSDTAFRTSAMELGLASAHQGSRGDYYGSFCAPMERARVEGVCREEAFQTAVETWSQTQSTNGKKEIQRSLDQLTQYYDDYQDYLRTHHGFLDLERDEARRKELAQGARCYLEKIGVTVQRVPSISSLESLLQEGSELKFLQGVLAHACSQSGQRKSVQLPSRCVSRAFLGMRSTQIQKIVDSRFDGPAPLMPFGISVCGRALKHGRKAMMDPLCDPNHMVLVIGREKREGRCQYRIRNSWGTDCSQYKDWKCENGDLWVDREDLGRLAQFVHFIE